MCISNRFLLTALAVALIWRIGTHPGDGVRFVDTLAGGALPFLLLFPFFCFRMIGAGDIKLLTVLGVLFGAAGSLWCLFWSFAIGSVFSVGLMAANQNAGERFRYLIAYVRDDLPGGRRRPYRNEAQGDAVIHFSVPVLMTVLMMTGG